MFSRFGSNARQSFQIDCLLIASASASSVSALVPVSAVSMMVIIFRVQSHDKRQKSMAAFDRCARQQSTACRFAAAAKPSTTSIMTWTGICAELESIQSMPLHK